jgi:ornithine decarboxylase
MIAPGRFELAEETGAVPTPCLVLDLDRIAANVTRLRSAFAALRPALYYAVKANPDPSVLALLRDLDCGFDVASIREIRMVQALGVPGEQLTFSATVKVPTHIAEAFARGVDCFAFDSPAEVEKLARLAPGARVVLRVEVPPEGSRWPLDGKFGVPEDQASELLRLARARGLRPWGLTFHVGSQCLRPQSWVDAIERCGVVWQMARAAGIDLELVNLGGGIPARYAEDVPGVVEIGTLVARAAGQAFGPEVAYALEPGRAVVADAGVLTTSVIGKAERHGRPWLFVDLSIYAGLLEVIGGWSYPIRTAKDHLVRRPTTLAGPSCDSTDILARDVDLPDLDVGDRLELLAAGAYTTSYEQYNGFEFPTVVPVARDVRVTVANRFVQGGSS